MGKTLFIAEKPKVALELMKSSRFRNAKKVAGSMPYYGYFENEKYIVSWCIGHLMELMNPEDHDEKYKTYNFEHLPLIFSPKFKIKEDTKEQFNILSDLLKREDVTTVANCCDKDKEGEGIFREIYEYVGVEKRMLRLFTASYEEAELEAALNGLLDGSDFDSLAEAAKARQYLDHLIGINLTRGATTRLANNQFLLASGRVQMCLLNEIRQREMAIQNYKEQTYYKLGIKTENGIIATMKTEEQQVDPRPVDALGERIKGTKVEVEEFNDRNSTRKPKLLYNLTDIYKDAFTKFKVNAAGARKHIQALYEGGWITYPRSSARHLPTEMVEKVLNTIAVLENTPYSELINKIDCGSISSKHRTFNDELVNSHYAIIPTEKLYNSENRDKLEVSLYDMIVKRFIQNFMPSASFKVREITLKDQEGNIYLAKEKMLVDKGFLEICHEDIEEDTSEDFSLPELQKGEQLTISETMKIESKTSKPSLHTESSILTFMETAGRKIDDEHLRELMKGKRIGTVATEETFIPKLLERLYIKSDSGKLSTTAIGRKFVDTFPVSELKNPTFTAELEGMISEIENKELSYDEFIDKSNDFVRLIIEEISKVDTSVSKDFVSTWSRQIEVARCKCKKGKIIDKGNFYGCTAFPGCDYRLSKVLMGKDLDVEQVEKLFVTGESDYIKGFKHEGNEFGAFLCFKDGRIGLRRPTVEELSLGKCPTCKKGHVIPKGSIYGCSEFKSGCKFKLAAKIKEKTIPAAQIKKLLDKGETGLISGFKGDHGEFTAVLTLKNGQFGLRLATEDELMVAKCPKCKKGKVLPRQNFYGCTEYKNGCDYRLPGQIKEKKIPAAQIKKLIEKGETDFINGFKGEKGDFTAALVIQADGLKFKFPTTDDRTIGKCPLCKSRVITGKTSYLCEQYKKTCDFFIPGVFLEKKITSAHVKKILEKNKTDLIEGFVSTKTGKKFSARLSYNREEKRLVMIFEKKK